MEKCALDQLETILDNVNVENLSPERQDTVLKIAEEAQAESFMLQLADLTSDMVMAKSAAAQEDYGYYDEDEEAILDELLDY